MKSYYGVSSGYVGGYERTLLVYISLHGLFYYHPVYYRSDEKLTFISHAFSTLKKAKKYIRKLYRRFPHNTPSLFLF